MKIGTVVTAMTLALALGASAYAQSSRWADPYQRGVRAFESGRHAEAVSLLERAVAADPRAAANKIIEGVFRTDYFPYYYLGLAYLELKQFDKARENLDKARPTLTRQRTAAFNDAESRLKRALTTPPPPRNAAFEAAVRQADASLNGKQYEAAIRQFDQLRTSDAAEYGRTGLGARRDEAVRGFAGQLIDEARMLIQGDSLRAARGKLQQADQLLPGQRPIADLLADLSKREDDYQQLKTAAQADFTAKSYSSARDKFEQAQTVHPELFASDNLGARLTEVSRLAESVGRGGVPVDPGPKNEGIDSTAEGRRIADQARQLIVQGKYAEADSAYSAALKADAKNQEALAAIDKATKFKALRDEGLQLNKSRNIAAAERRLVDARNLDARRFEREGLTSTLEALVKSNGGEPATLALKEALLALLKGDAQQSIAILEPALSRGGDKLASLHAYLGVAYATRALSAPKPDDESRLRDKAIEQFKLAAAAEPSYRLSNRVVSPAIIRIYEQAQR